MLVSLRALRFASRAARSAGLREAELYNYFYRYLLYKRSHSGVKLHGFTVAVYLFEEPSPHPPPVADSHLVYAFLLRESSRFLGLCDRPCAFYHRELGQLMSGVTCFCNSRFFERAFFCFAFFALLFFVIKRHLGAESTTVPFRFLRSGPFASGALGRPSRGQLV